MNIMLVRGCGVSIIVNDPLNLQMWIEWILAKGGVPEITRFEDPCQGE